MVRFFIKVFQKIVNWLYRLEQRRSTSSFDAASHRQGVIGSTVHDMAKDPDENFYTRQYWHYFEAAFKRENVSLSGTFLDLGCGQGRFSLILAKWCASSAGKVIGVDISEAAISQARAYAKQAQLKNVFYQTEGILEFLKRQPDKTYDAIFFLEVIFFMPEYEAVLKEMQRVAKSGALVCISFRSQYFDALYSLIHHQARDLETILTKRQSPLWGSAVCFTWQTSAEARRIVEASGFSILEFVGIGTASGISGDPLAPVSQPSLLTTEDRERLMALELQLGGQFPDAGRYMLCIAKNVDTLNK